MTGTTWHIITGEYPPQRGGVSDYTQQVAFGLTKRGCKVHVWSAGDEGDRLETDEPNREVVEVHRVAGGFSASDLRRLGRLLSGFPSPRTLLVQYVPNAFGMRGLNLLFCLWLLGRRLFAGDDIRVMFHEPFFYFGRQRLRRNLLAAMNRVMAVALLAASRVVYISIPAWEKMLRPYALLRDVEMVWLPIPSTIPRVEDEEGVASVRGKYAPVEAGRLIVGHFGTYGDHIRPGLGEIFVELFNRRSDAVGLFIGANGEEFLASLTAAHPEFRGRLFAAGYLSKREASLHLQACDLAIQYYPDGASTRRTSLMAALLNGTATISSSGHLTEPFWRRDESVPLAPAVDKAALVQLALRLLGDSSLRERTRLAGRELYLRELSLDQSIKILLRDMNRGCEPELLSSTF